MISRWKQFVFAVVVVGLGLLAGAGIVYAQGRGAGSRILVKPVQELDRTLVRTIDSGLGESHETFGVSSLGIYAGGAGLIVLGSESGVAGEGAVQTVGKAMASLISNPPASAQVWLADLMQNSPIVPQAYAQGIGFRALDPILPIWKAFRDLAYVFFVIIFVIMGFMIMFRQKLGGQTAVTITSAIPNLVVTLLLVTFSYAIAGFVVDLMYLSIYLMIGVFKTQNLLPDSISYTALSGSVENITLENVALGNNIFMNGLDLIFKNSVTTNAASSVGNLVADFFGDAGEGVAGAVAGFISGGASVVAYLVFALAIFFAVFKTFFSLLMSYVTFLIGVIFSPFLLLAGAFSGKTDVRQWLKNLIGGLAPFPVVVGMILLAMVFGGKSDTEGIGFRGGADSEESAGSGFLPPQIGIFNSTSGIGAIQGLLAIGIIMLLPEAVKLSKDWVGAKNEPFEKYMGIINSNLQKGWKGGQVIDGVGPKIPGADVLTGGLIKSGASGIGGGLLGMAGGGFTGAKVLSDNARKQGGGGFEQIVAGTIGAVGGAAIGGTGGAIVGAGKPMVDVVVKKYGPELGKKYEWVDKATKAYRDWQFAQGAQQNAENTANVKEQTQNSGSNVRDEDS